MRPAGDSHHDFWVLRGAHLASVWAFAVVQPLYAALNAAFFAGSFPADAVIFAVTVVALPPLAMIGLELLVARKSRRAAWRLHTVVIALLVALFVSSLANRAGHLSAPVQVSLSLACGAALAAAYLRFAWLRDFFSALAPVPLVFLIAFLFFSDASDGFLAGEDGIAVRAPKSRTPVVLIVLDELPTTSLLTGEGRIDAQRFPNLASLARHATWFRNATSVHELTEDALPALLTGRISRPDQAAVAADHPESLFTLLGGSYRVTASEPVTDLCPEVICPRAANRSRAERLLSLTRRGARVSLEQSLPESTRRRLLRPQILGGDPEAQVQGFRSSVVKKQPALGVLHVLLPHQPWRFLPSGREYDYVTKEEELLPARAVDVQFRSKPYLIEAYQRHLLQVQYTDRVLGRLLRRLQQQGLFDRSLIVVTADHGISFQLGEAGRRTTPQNVHDILPVPLFVKLPGQASGRTSETLARTVDIVPTIADALGISPPPTVDGRSLLRPSRGLVPKPSIRNREGTVIALDRVAFFARRERSLMRKIKMFGSGNGVPGLYGGGPHPELIALPVKTQTVKSRAGLRVRFDSGGSFNEDRKGPAPVRIAGELRGTSARPGLPLAVAVNGQILATTWTYRSAGRASFSALIPEDSLRRGRNRVAALAIRGRGSRLRLEELRVG